MSRHKLRIHNTDTDNLISNLRGEVGEIISSWVLYKDIMVASDLTEEEMINPLFISGAITKSNSKYHLNVLKFEEYMVRKYRIVILDQERAMFRYNEKCYEQFTEKALNKLCQDELKGNRNLFGKSSLSEFIHYAVGDTLEDSERVKKDQLNYLTMQNGLYKIDH